MTTLSDKLPVLSEEQDPEVLLGEEKKEKSDEEKTPKLVKSDPEEKAEKSDESGPEEKAEKSDESDPEEKAEKSDESDPEEKAEKSDEEKTPKLVESDPEEKAEKSDEEQTPKLVESVPEEKSEKSDEESKQLDKPAHDTPKVEAIRPKMAQLEPFNLDSDTPKRTSPSAGPFAGEPSPEVTPIQLSPEFTSIISDEGKGESPKDIEEEGSTSNSVAASPAHSSSSRIRSKIEDAVIHMAQSQRNEQTAYQILSQWVQNIKDNVQTVISRVDYLESNVNEIKKQVQETTEEEESEEKEQGATIELSNQLEDLVKYQQEYKSQTKELKTSITENIKNLTNVSDDLKDQISSLTLKLESVQLKTQSEIKNLKESKKYKTLKSANKVLSHDIANISKMAENSQSRLDDITTELIELRKFGEFSKKLADTKKEIESLKNTTDTRISNILDALEKPRSVSSDGGVMENILNKIGDLSSKINVIDGKIKALAPSRQLEDIKKDQESMKSNISALTEKVKRLEMDNKESNNDERILKLETQVSNLLTIIQSGSGDVALASDEAKALDVKWTKSFHTVKKQLREAKKMFTNYVESKST